MIILWIKVKLLRIIYIYACVYVYSFRHIIKNINKHPEIKLMMINKINIFYASLMNKINATLASVRVRAISLYLL